jgi:hypothetical protein
MKALGDEELVKATMRAESCECTPVSFTKHFEVLHIRSSRPRYGVLDFVDTGSELIHLHPSHKTMHANPDLLAKIRMMGKVDLDAAHIPDYLLFAYTYLSHLDLIGSVDAIEWIPASAMEEDDAQLRQEALKLVVAPMRVTPAGSDFDVVASAVKGAELVELKLKVSRSGEIDVLNEKTVMEYIPVIEYVGCAGVVFDDD